MGKIDFSLAESAPGWTAPPEANSRNCICDDAELRSGTVGEGGEGVVDGRGTTILIDMDNTLNDWDSQFRRLMHHFYPEFQVLPPESRRIYDIQCNYPESERAKILSLTQLRGFWASMPVAGGAQKALKEMKESGFEIFILSAPDDHYTGRCAQEKYDWLEANFGPEWKSRLILTPHKAMVKGHILIDDKPDAHKSTHSFKPDWLHCLYCQPYNQNLKTQGGRLHNWTQWKTAIKPLLKQAPNQ